MILSADQKRSAVSGNGSQASHQFADKALEDHQYCVFRVGRERFCLPMVAVEEILEWPLVARVPRAPLFLMGVFNLRGTIVPVIDIVAGEGRRADFLPRHVVVASLDAEEGKEPVRLGMAVDELVGNFSSRQPLELAEMPRNMSYCCGMLRHETDRLALALDLKRTVETFAVGPI